MSVKRDNSSGKIRKVNAGSVRRSSSSPRYSKKNSLDSTRKYKIPQSDGRKVSNRSSSLNRNIKRSSNASSGFQEKNQKKSIRTNREPVYKRSTYDFASDDFKSDSYSDKPKMSRKMREAKRRKKKIKKIICIALIVIIAFPVYSIASLLKKMSDAYDPSIVGGVFDNITHINKKGITNILLLGSDAREGEKESRTDAMMILTIDTVHDSIKLTSLARDAYVDIPGHGKTKLTHAYFYGGIELLTETIENNFGIDIHNYALVDFESFMYIIDAVGGVSVEVKESELDELNKFIPETYGWYNNPKGDMELVGNPGYQVLNGYQALSFSRIRKNDSAFERDRRQRDVMEAMFTGVKSMSWFEYPKLLDAVLPYVKTNMKTTQIVSFGISVMRMGNLDIKQFEFPISGSSHSIEGKYGNAGWVIQFDDESVKILQDFIFEDIEYNGD